jgi:AraC-like DNA-binding protein
MAGPERIFARTEEHTLLSPASPGIDLSELTPTPRLRRYVDRLRLGYERIPDGQTVVERVIPDGAIHLLFNSGDCTGLVAEVTGATTTAAVITLRGTIAGVGVQLRPGGVAAILGVPAGELAGRTVHPSDLWGRDADHALEQLAAAPHGRRRAHLIERLLLERLARTQPDPHRGADLAMQHVTDTGGRLSVAALARHLGVGERRLEQIFHSHVGMSPKAAARLARFRAAVDLLQRTPRPSWAEIATSAGYYDQAHLVRDWKRITGLAPTAFTATAGFGSVQDAPARRR